MCKFNIISTTWLNDEKRITHLESTIRGKKDEKLSSI